MYGLTLSVIWIDTGARTTATIAGGAAFEGRPDPWVIFLPPEASYTLKIATSKILLHGSERALSQIHDRWKLTVTYVGKPALDYGPGGKSIPFSLSKNAPLRSRSARDHC
jgi:hypothetical protein